jgi:hypothetical protein
MILGFKTKFPWGEPTNFVEKITKRPGFTPKLHSLRKSKKLDRWKAGNYIHFATGVRTKNYTQFYDGVCYSTQQIRIEFKHAYKPIIHVDDRKLSDSEIETLAKNDGFDNVAVFCEWFRKEESPNQIIHWTDLKY